MDNFNVPKKVNRHVLKALNLLSEGNFKEGITTSRICNQVKYQMRNLVPVPNVEHCIQKSLKNLSEVGLIERQGPTRYCIGRNYAPPYATNSNHGQPDKRIFRIADYRNRSRSALDPNLKRAYSEDSLSGDEFDKTRKRMRSNTKQLKYDGRSTVLPRARQHYNPTTMFEINEPFIRITDCNNGYTEGEKLSPNSTSKTSTLEFLLATVTPVPSLKIVEVADADNDTIGLSDIGENSTTIKNNTTVSETTNDADHKNSTISIGDNSQIDTATETTADTGFTDDVGDESIPMEERPISTFTYFN